MTNTQLAIPIAERTAAGLIPAAAIDALARQIAAQYDPERIYLFGSYAYGQPTPDSDVDIMVVMETDDTMHQAGNIRSDIPFDYPHDVLVYTPANFAERLALGDYFIEQVAQLGRILYDSNRPTLRWAMAHPPVQGPVYDKVGDVYLKKLTAEWVERAEADYKGAFLMFQASDASLYGLACFLAQQCAEKYLKAYLQEHGVRFAKTHELDTLLTLCQPLDPGFAQLQKAADGLKDYAVDPRYPGLMVTSNDVQNAYNDASQIRTFVRAKLGI